MKKYLPFAIALTSLVALSACSQTPAKPTSALATVSWSNLYVNPNTSAAVWANANGGDARAAVIKAKISTRSSGKWITTSGLLSQVSPYATAAANAGQVPVFVAYYIPGRDCGNFAAGGAPTSAAYKTWIDSFAAAIGSRSAIVVLEPDALPLVSSCATSNATVVAGLIAYGVDKFKAAAPNTKVYVDAGHSTWLSSSAAAALLKTAGVARAAGFSVNVSNFNATANELTYANAISSALGGAKFVIDTSRNGAGSNGEWCNPAGRKIGNAPALVNSGALQYYLWIKVPGESDGNCGVGPGTMPGDFMPQVGYDMAK